MLIAGTIRFLSMLIERQKVLWMFWQRGVIWCWYRNYADNEIGNS